jgi:hypothetical protein
MCTSTYATQFILRTGSSLNKHKSESTKSYYYFLSAVCDEPLELLALIMTFGYDTICYKPISLWIWHSYFDSRMLPSSGKV